MNLSENSGNKRILRKRKFNSNSTQKKNINFNLDIPVIKFVSEAAKEFGVELYLVGG